MSSKVTKKGLRKRNSALKNVEFTAEITDNVPTYYCNYIQVGHSEHEFFFNIFQAPPLLKPHQLELAQRGQKVPLEPLSQIIMPAKVGARLLGALKAQKEKYESIFGSLDEKRL